MKNLIFFGIGIFVIYGIIHDLFGNSDLIATLVTGLILLVAYFRQKSLSNDIPNQNSTEFLIDDRDVDFKWLPYEYNMCDMFRKELLGDDFLFTDWGWIYQYNSIPNNKEDRLTLYWMKKTYEHLYG